MIKNTELKNDCEASKVASKLEHFFPHCLISHMQYIIYSISSCAVKSLISLEVLELFLFLFKFYWQDIYKLVWKIYFEQYVCCSCSAVVASSFPHFES